MIIQCQYNLRIGTNEKDTRLTTTSERRQVVKMQRNLSQLKATLQQLALDLDLLALPN